MQIYLKPYPHSTYCNVPYAPEKRSGMKEQNYGFFDVKKYPGKLKQIPELKEVPEMLSLIENVNKNSIFETYGINFRMEPLVGFPVRHVYWTWVNLGFAELDLNTEESTYYQLIGQFLQDYVEDGKENAIIEFILNPTNFHDRDRFRKGVKPKEETVVFRGWCLNVKIMGVGDTFDGAKQLWQHGADVAKEFLVKYKHS